MVRGSKEGSVKGIATGKECPYDDVGTILKFYGDKDKGEKILRDVEIYYERHMMRKAYFYPILVFSIIILSAIFIIIVTQIML